MAELKDKMVSLEHLKIVYEKLKKQFELPDYSSADNGKILVIRDGKLAWISAEDAGVTIVDE